MLLAEVLRKTGSEIGDRIAYVAADGWPVTYRELDKLSDEVAVGLLRRGVREGDVVGLAMPSNPDYVVAYGALDKIGACAAGVNPFLMARERRDALATAEPAFVIATPSCATASPTTPRCSRYRSRRPPARSCAACVWPTKHRHPSRTIPIARWPSSSPLWGGLPLAKGDAPRSRLGQDLQQGCHADVSDWREMFQFWGEDEL